MSFDDEGYEAVLRRLVGKHFGVLGYVVLNQPGVPVKFHGMDNAEALRYSALVSGLVNKLNLELVDRPDNSLLAMLTGDEHAEYRKAKREREKRVKESEAEEQRRAAERAQREKDKLERKARGEWTEADEAAHNEREAEEKKKDKQRVEEPDVPVPWAGVQTLRLRTTQYEIVIAPEREFTLVTIHDPNYVEPEEEVEEVEAE